MSKINEKAWVRPYNASQEYHKIHNFLFGTAEQGFVLPKYQRNYVWGEKNIKQFFNDIEYHYEDEKPMWLGSILVSTGGGHGGKIVLIDGQQRILSYTLIWNILTEFKYNNIFDIKGENEWDDIYSGTENITYKTFLDYIDNKKKNIEPKIENKHFKAIIKIIYQKKEEWLSKEILSKIQDWIKEFLYINVLCCENTYEYFENLNSKNEPLNLKAKCYAYMASKYPNKVLQNKSIISWWLSNKYDKYIKKNALEEEFINIFYDNVQNTHLDFYNRFKKINENNIEKFVKYLETLSDLINQKKNQKVNFKKTYYFQIAWNLYWPLYISAKITERSLGGEPFITNFLFDNIWKMDLYIHLLNQGKNLNKKDVTEVAKNLINSKSPKMAERSIHNFFITRIRKGKSDYPGGDLILSKKEFENIGLGLNNSLRIKILFWILLGHSSKKDFSKSINKQKFSDFWNDNENYEIEHIVPQINSWPSLSKEEINYFCNLTLISKSFNTELGNKDFEEKMTKYFETKNNDSFYKPCWIFIRDIHHTIQKTQTTQDTLQKIKDFWEESRNIFYKKFLDILQPNFNLKITYYQPPTFEIQYKCKKDSSLTFKSNRFFISETGEKYFYGKVSNRDKAQQQFKIGIKTSELNYLLNNKNNYIIVAYYQNYYYRCRDNYTLLKNLKKNTKSPNLTFNNVGSYWKIEIEDINP